MHCVIPEREMEFALSPAQVFSSRPFCESDYAQPARWRGPLLSPWIIFCVFCLCLDRKYIVSLPLTLHGGSSNLIRAIIFIFIASSSGTLFLKSRPTCGVRGLWARGPYFSPGELRRIKSNFVKAGERETPNPPTTSLFSCLCSKEWPSTGVSVCFFLFFPRFFTRVIVLAGVNGDLVVSRQWAFSCPSPTVSTVA